MKGFIEVTTQPEPQTKLLINVNQIIYVGSEEDNHARIVIGQDVRTDIALLVTATYDEIKKQIKKAKRWI